MTRTSQIDKTSPRQTWHEAARIEEQLGANECELLEYIARLPFIWVRDLQTMLGYADGSDVYRRLRQLRSLGLVGMIQPVLRPGHNPHLLYLTDLGLAVLALFWQVEVSDLARRLKLRAEDLLARLPTLAHLIASYEMLAALAASRQGWPRLLTWIRPWWCRFYRPMAKTPTTVRLFASVMLAWGDVGQRFLLLPDLGAYPLRLYRPMLNNLLLFRQLRLGKLAPLVIASPNKGRANVWRVLLQETARARGDRPLAACVTTSSELQDDLQPFVARCPLSPRAELPTWSPSYLQPLKARRWIQPVPCLVGDAPEAP